MSGPSVSDQADAIACSGGDLVDLGLQNVNLNDNVTIETTNGLLCKSASSGVGVSPQYGFFTEHATENSLAKHTYTRPDLLKVVQGEDGNVSQTIKKAFVNPQAALVTTGTFSSSGNSDQRVCGNGQFAQVAPPGTTIRRSHTNPEVKFPVADGSGTVVRAAHLVRSVVSGPAITPRLLWSRAALVGQASGAETAPLPRRLTSKERRPEPASPTRFAFAFFSQDARLRAKLRGCMFSPPRSS